MTHAPTGPATGALTGPGGPGPLGRDAASPARQVAALMALRWSLLRGGRRGLLVAGIALVAVLGPAMLALGAWASAILPPGRRTEVVELLPAAYLVLAIGLVVAAVASSGGRELLPRDQLVAYPVSPAADHLGALLLAPLNLAWLLQTLALGMVTGMAAGTRASRAAGLPEGAPLPAGAWWGVVLAGAVTAAWVLAVTAVAQVAAWSVELVRSLPAGRWWLRGVGLGAAAGMALWFDTDRLVRLLDRTPTAYLTEQGLAAAEGDHLAGLRVVAGLVLAALVAVALGAWLCGVLVRRPGRELARQETHHYRSRPLPAGHGLVGEVRVWRRLDWASVRRASPLRRGLLVLLITPAVGGLLARMAATDLVLLTSVVASGAGLLFGVNAFALDGPGATWRASLPTSPRAWVLARALVLTELVGLTAVIATSAAVVWATGQVTVTTVVATVMAVVTMTGQVVARCLRWSTTRPHGAPLRTPRDSPAPPGEMASYSAQLVLATIGLGIVLSVSARTPWALLPVLVCLPSLVWSAASIRASLMRWDDPLVRARVVDAVARG